MLAVEPPDDVGPAHPPVVRSGRPGGQVGAGEVLEPVPALVELHVGAGAARAGLVAVEQRVVRHRPGARDAAPRLPEDGVVVAGTRPVVHPLRAVGVVGGGGAGAAAVVGGKHGDGHEDAQQDEPAATRIFFLLRVLYMYIQVFDFAG